MRDEERSVWQTKPEREQTEETEQSRWGFRGKTVWDWMALLIVPLVLVVIGLLFTLLQDARQQDIEDRRAQQAQKIEDRRAQQAQKIENKRAEAERELAVQRAQDEALQAYLDQMSTLLLEKDLRSSTEVNPTEESQEARALARARTLTVLSRLDPSRKTALMQFLVEADLVQRVDGRNPIIILRGADLSEVDLSNTDLSHADLPEVDLSDANLSGAYLFKADLRGTNLGGANLGGANLNVAYLGGANLRDASLRDAIMLDAYLGGANLRDTNLSNAWLKDANLSDADLGDANLSNAFEWTEKQLTATASLKGATMPNGQKYEDWLKSKD